MDYSKLYLAIHDKDVRAATAILSSIKTRDDVQDALYATDDMGRTCLHAALAYVMLEKTGADVLAMLQLLDKHLDKEDGRFLQLANSRYNDDSVLHVISGIKYTDAEGVDLMKYFLSKEEYRLALNYVAFDRDGQTFLHKLCSGRGRPKTLKAVAESPVDQDRLRQCANIRTRASSLTALHMAGMSSRQIGRRRLQKIASYLDQMGADATLVGAKGEVMMVHKPSFMMFLYDNAIRLARPTVGDAPVARSVTNLALDSYSSSGIDRRYVWTIKMATYASYDPAVRMHPTNLLASIVAPSEQVKLHVQYLPKSRGIALAIDNLYFGSSYEKGPGEVRVRAAEIFAGIQQYNASEPANLINRVILRNFSYLEYIVRDDKYRIPLVVYRYLLYVLKRDEARTQHVEERAAQGGTVPVEEAIELAGERKRGKVVDTFSVYSKSAMLYGFHSRSGPQDGDDDASNKSLTMLSSNDVERFDNELDTLMMVHSGNHQMTEEEVRDLVLMPALSAFVNTVQKARYNDQSRAEFDRDPFAAMNGLYDKLHVSTDVRDMGEYTDSTAEVFVLKGAEEEWSDDDENVPGPIYDSSESSASDASSTSDASGASDASDASGRRVFRDDESESPPPPLGLDDSFAADGEPPPLALAQGKPAGYYTQLLREGMNVPQHWIEEEEDLLNFVDEIVREGDENALCCTMSRLQF